MGTLYVALTTIALFAYLHIAFTYLFSVKYLSLLESSENYNILPLAASFSGVCLFTYVYYFTPTTHSFFPFAFNLVMLSVIIAKFFYFNSLRKFLKAKFPVDRIYFYLAAFYGIASLGFMIHAAFNGMDTYFDTNSPERSSLILRRQLLPFEINDVVKALFLPNYVLGFGFYCYLLYVASKRKEKLVAFGIGFTILSILYTNSYHFFGAQYWIPLNIVADLFEMARLHWAQREKLEAKLADYNLQFNNLNSQLASLQTKHSELQVYKHDLRNDLSISSLNIHKAKLYLRKVESPYVGNILECLENSLVAQQMASNYVSADSRAEEVCLEELLLELGKLLQVPVKMENLNGARLKVAKGKLENAFVNLIKNAKEANQHSEDMRITISLSLLGDQASLRLKDTGLFERIAEPATLFTKGFSTKASKGRGLGLYSVKTFMEEQGGKVELLNDGGNVCFALNFPKRLLICDS